MSIILDGPFQSWGASDKFTNRYTEQFPTKSGICGLICAAKGLSRDNEFDEWKNLVSNFNSLKMTSIQIPKIINNKKIQVSTMIDYQTVLGVKKTNGSKNNECVTTNRQYLMDSKFGIILDGNSSFLEDTVEALKNPKWFLYLGRKCCVPSTQIFNGLFDTKQECLKSLIGEKDISKFNIQEDVDSFSEGNYYVRDLIKINGSSHYREYSNRRVKVTYKNEN